MNHTQKSYSNHIKEVIIKGEETMRVKVWSV